MEQLQKYISRITNFINELKENDPKYPNDTIHRKINRKLLKYKEIKILYDKTGIHPIFFLYILLICLIFIFIGFFDNILTIIIGTAYPLYISYKTLQNYINDNEEDEDEENEDENINDMIQWLSYWVVYSFFINIESIFKRILIYIPFYFFIKVIFLLFCFLPQYQLSGWIYNNFIRVLFIKYEQNILNMSNQLIKTLTHSENDDKNTYNKSKTMNIKNKNIENDDNKNSEIKSDSYRKNDEKKDKRNKNNKKNVN
jgi:receptor expression-enhancing protein 5/6